MKTTRLEQTLNNVYLIETEIRKFYDKLIKLRLKFPSVPMDLLIDFNELANLITLEEKEHLYFCNNPIEIEFLLNNIQSERSIKHSEVIPNYQKILPSSIYLSWSTRRLESYLQDYQLNANYTNFSSQINDEIHADPYRILYIYQDPNYVRKYIKEEYTKIFFNILENNIKNKLLESDKDIADLLTIESYLLFTNPSLEKEVIETYLHHHPMEINNEELFEACGMSQNCCRYINEAFTIEQGLEAVSKLTDTTDSNSTNIFLNTLYLQSCIAMAKEKQTVEIIQGSIKPNIIEKMKIKK